MMDPGYAVIALAWTVVWAAGGLVVRQWLAEKAAAARRRPHKPERSTR